MIHPRSEGKGTPRGEGFELRTDNAGAVRAAQGLLITTEAQQNARGKQPDRSPALAQLEAAQNLTQQLGDAAQNQRANKPKTDPALNADQLKDKKPHVLMHGHGGAAITTPQSATIATGKDLNQVSLRDTHQTSGKRWIHNVGESASFFVANAANKIKTAIKLIAAKGDILVQAQSNDVEITADKKITITACKENLTASAGKEFLLQSGGGYIKISGGNIDIHCPGTLSMKAKSIVHVSGGGGSVAKPTMPSGGGFIVPQLAMAAASLAPTSLTTASPELDKGENNSAVITGLGADVDQLASQSPSLQKDLQSLQDNGWKIVYGANGGGSFADRDAAPKVITIDGNLKSNPVAATQTLAHEVGHATYPYTADYSSKW